MKKGIAAIVALAMIMSLIGMAAHAQGITTKAPGMAAEDVSLYRDLKYGMNGEDVSALQLRLTELKYYHGKISGNYLEGTTSAIGSFQKKSGLTSTGKADVQTQELLFSDKAVSKNGTLLPEPSSTPVPAGDEDIVIAGDGEDLEALNKDYERSLKRGSTGVLVKDVQKRLTDLGYYTGPVSGNYMNQTIAAMKAFQKNNGLTQDGVAGPETWAVLFNDAGVADANATPRPTPEPTPVPYAITVDVNNQVITVYGLDEKGEHTDVVRQMITSTGTKSFPSDVGDWVLNGRTARWAYFPAWGSHAQYWTRINSSIAFHSVIYNKVDTMSLSVKSYNMLGQRASHGCIRLLVHDAKWVYDNIGKGTVVTITENLPKDEELAISLKPAPLNRKNMLPQSTPAPTPPPAYVSGQKPPAISRNLNTGSEGEDVYWMQSKLAELGYYKGTITGGYYSGTKEAVKAFQKEHSLKTDGVAGKATLQRLYENELATPTPKPTAEAIATPKPGK